MSSVKRLEAEKARAAAPTLHHETAHGTTYDADALAAKQAKDVYALMPWVDRDHDDHATKEQQEKEQKAKAEAKKAEEEKVRKQMDDAKAVAIATQLSAYSHSMDGATSRKFIQQLDAIDNPYLRAQVKARFADLSGRSLEGFITDCSDWNNNGDNRDKDAALALISDKRSDTERAIEKLPPAKREAMLADAHKRATKLRAARALHDTGDDNAKKMLNELAGCDPLEIEMMRKAVREQSMGEDNLYQAIDDGMKGKNEDAAVAMLTGDRVQSAHLELAATKDVGKMRERISKLTPDERMRLQVNPNTMAAIAALENPADREELQMALGGNAARADAVKLGNALKFKDEGYLMGGMGAKNDDRRSPAEVLKLFEGMPADQVKAAVAAWNEMNPLRPMESMLEARWGDDSDPTEMRRLQAMMKGDKALNAAIRVEQGIREDNQEMIEAALAHSGPEEKKKLMAAIAEEDRNTNEQRLIMSGHTPDEAKKLAKGRDAATQLNTYYDKLHAERTEKDNALGEFDLNDGMRAASEAGRKRLHDEIDDKRHAALELATDGKVSVATDMHRAKDDKAREEILNRLETDDELHQAIATYHDRHGKQMLPMDKDRSDMNALELRIDNIRRYGPVAKRPADLQAKLDYQLYKVAYSSSLEHDEAGRGGGGTQTMMRQALMWEQSKLQDPTIIVETPTTWNNPMEALAKAQEEKPLPPLGMQRDPSAADIEADLPATKLFAKDGLKDEASRKDFDRAVSTNAAAGEAQQEAKKRLADRTVARLAMVAKIAGALTGNPLIAAAIMLGEGVAGMAIKNEILGRDYDPKEDLQALAIKLVAEAVSGGVAGKFGSFAGSMAKLGVNEVVGGVAQGKGVGDILLGLGTGALAASLPGALKERIKGVIATGNETLMRKVLGEVVAHVGEAGMSTVIAVAGGASVADAALDAGISMGGSLTQKAVKSGGHPTTTEHPHPSEHASPSHGSETHTPEHASESHAQPTHSPHPSEAHDSPLPHPTEAHASTSRPHPTEPHAPTSPHPTEVHPATSTTLRSHPAEAHAPHTSPTAHGDAHVVANGHHAESDHHAGATGAKAGGRNPLHEPTKDPAGYRVAANSLEQQHAATAQRAKMTKEQRATHDAVVATLANPAAHAMIERALAAGNSMENVVKLRDAMRGMSHDEILRRFSGEGIVQFYRESCVPAAYQIMLAEADPIYAMHLHENPQELQRGQETALVQTGGRRIPRPDAHDGPEALKRHLADPQRKKQLSQSSDHEGTDGIEPTEMVGTPLHSKLEKTVGSRYETLTHAAVTHDQPGQGTYGKFPFERVNEALHRNQSVALSHGGHEIVLTRIIADADGTLKYVVTDPDRGRTYLADPAQFSNKELPVASITLPAQQRTNNSEGSDHHTPTSEGHVESHPLARTGVSNDVKDLFRAKVAASAATKAQVAPSEQAMELRARMEKAREQNSSVHFETGADVKVLSGTLAHDPNHPKLPSVGYQRFTYGRDKAPVSLVQFPSHKNSTYINAHPTSVGVFNKMRRIADKLGIPEADFLHEIARYEDTGRLDPTLSKMNKGATQRFLARETVRKLGVEGSRVPTHFVDEADSRARILRPGAKITDLEMPADIAKIEDKDKNIIRHGAAKAHAAANDMLDNTPLDEVSARSARDVFSLHEKDAATIPKELLGRENHTALVAYLLRRMGR